MSGLNNVEAFSCVVCCPERPRLHPSLYNRITAAFWAAVDFLVTFIKNFIDYFRGKAHGEMPEIDDFSLELLSQTPQRKESPMPPIDVLGDDRNTLSPDSNRVIALLKELREDLFKVGGSMVDFGKIDAQLNPKIFQRFFNENSKMMTDNPEYSQLEQLIHQFSSRVDTEEKESLKPLVDQIGAIFQGSMLGVFRKSIWG